MLHGPRAFSHAGRAILHSICDGDPGKFKSFGCRFTDIAYPGEALIAEGWQAGDGKYIIRTKTQAVGRRWGMA